MRTIARSSSDAQKQLMGKIISIHLIMLICLLLISCGQDSDRYTDDGRLIIQYWEKWAGFEADAMRQVVDKYNASQNKVFVSYLTTSQIDRKLLLATAGGNPPDVAGFWTTQMAPYANQDALIPLDRLMQRDGIRRDDYVPSIINLCVYQGFTWGLPTTPATMALHYNKRLFRQAGLDPERPPRTLAELDEFARRLTRRDADGQIVELGFTQTDPGWWNALWGLWFGASLFDGDDTINCEAPEFIQTLQWVKSYPETYGLKDLQGFGASTGGFDSAQNLFIAEKLAMQLQGVWMGNFIEKYNPDMEWGVAPFPAVNKDALVDTALVDADILVIPKGSRHIEQAWDFIKFVQKQQNMEMLCLAQRKFSPLREVSEGFYTNHPHPYIKEFRRLAESENVRWRPKHAIYTEYEGEMVVAFDKVFLGQKTPQEAMKEVKQRMQPKLDKYVDRWNLVKEKRIQHWKEQ